MATIDHILVRQEKRKKNMIDDCKPKKMFETPLEILILFQVLKF